jgi:hypothetical protein
VKRKQILVLRAAPSLPDRIDNFDWRGQMAFRAYGLTIGIRTTDLQILEKIRTILPFGSKPCAVGSVDFLYSLQLARRARIWRNSEMLLETRNQKRLLEALEASMAQTIAEFSRTDLFVHAGAVSWNGGAVVIPGRSCSGKSTLVAALVRGGAGYLSDEYAVIDARGRVRPFARPLALRSTDGRQIPTSVESLGGRVEPDTLPVSVVLVTRFVKDARFRPRRLSPGEVLLALLANTVPARTRAQVAITRLRRVATAAKGMKSVRDEAADIVTRILREAETKSVRQAHLAN